MIKLVKSLKFQIDRSQNIDVIIKKLAIDAVCPNYIDSVRVNTECLIHYRKPGLCPVLKSLPSAKYRALGKGHLCRVPHSAKLGTRQIGLCRVSGTRQNKALGKAKLCPVPDTRQSWALGKEAPGDNGTQRRPLCRVPSVWHSAKYWLCRVPRVSTRQNIHFAECQTLALGKIIFFLFFATNFFS